MVVLSQRVMNNSTFLFLCFQITCFGQIPDGSKIIRHKGKNVQIFTKNLDNRPLDQPVLVFESGLSMPLNNWDRLFKKISDSLPIFAYERQGIGKSDILKNKPSPEFSARRLHEILNELEIVPPYILVGHSIGGILINSFTVKYPNDVVGLVYIDVVDVLNWNKNIIQAIKIASNGSISKNIIREKLNDYFKSAPEGISKEWNEVYKLYSEEYIIPTRFTPPLTVPTAILISGKYEAPPPYLIIENFDFKVFDKELKRLRTEKFNEKIIDNPKAIILKLNHLGHNIHMENPTLVANIIDEVYFLSKE